MASVHKLGVDVFEYVEEHTDVSKYEKLGGKEWFLRDDIQEVRDDDTSCLMTEWLGNLYPKLKSDAKHGDIIEDCTAGYRMQGIYFVIRNPEFRVVVKDTRIDLYGNLPAEIKPIIDFPFHHWDLDNLKVVKYDAGDTFEFSWHGDGVDGYLPAELRFKGTWTRINGRSGILRYQGRFYMIESPVYGNLDHEMPTSACMADISEYKKLSRGGMMNL